MDVYIGNVRDQSIHFHIRIFARTLAVPHTDFLHKLHARHKIRLLLLLLFFLHSIQLSLLFRLWLWFLLLFMNTNTFHFMQRNRREKNSFLFRAFGSGFSFDTRMMSQWKIDSTLFFLSL